MQFEIIEQPFAVELIGLQGKVEAKCFGETGRRLMDAMWKEIRERSIENNGINHWVYPSPDELFTGVELVSRPAKTGSLAIRRFELARYARYLHRGPYDLLPGVWKQLSEALAERGERRVGPDMEIYGHWADDPAELETTILISVSPAAV